MISRFLRGGKTNFGAGLAWTHRNHERRGDTALHAPVLLSRLGMLTAIAAPTRVFLFS
jgi:hypothetical protein